MSIILASGGMDSLVALKMHLDEQPGMEHYLLFIDYGQPTAKEELACVAAWGKTYNLPVYTHTLPVSLITMYGNFPLFDRNMVVPWRNTLLIAIAATYCRMVDVTTIVHGAQVGDEEGYPDCRPAYFAAISAVLTLGDYIPHQIVTPVLNMTKVQIIHKGLELGVDFAMTSSAYFKADSLKADASAQARAKAFSDAGVPDPLFSVDR